MATNSATTVHSEFKQIVADFGATHAVVRQRLERLGYQVDATTIGRWLKASGPPRSPAALQMMQAYVRAMTANAGGSAGASRGGVEEESPGGDPGSNVGDDFRRAVGAILGEPPLAPMQAELWAALIERIGKSRTSISPSEERIIVDMMRFTGLSPREPRNRNGYL